MLLILCVAVKPDVLCTVLPSWATHSRVPLVQQVLGDVGQATLMMTGKASPHGGALRPSERQALAREIERQEMDRQRLRDVEDMFSRDQYAACVYFDGSRAVWC